MLDKILIRHCSPTLSSLKTASLFNYSFASDKKMEEMLSYWNKALNHKGVSLHVLCKRRGRALVYVCRNSKLEADLQKPGVKDFLTDCGYIDFSTDFCINRLKERIANTDGFPHEIGLFLGYPLGDVKGFIENEGKNFLCNGNWKVYCDECEAVKSFAKYKKCRDVYTQLFESRIKTVYQLTVSA